MNIDRASDAQQGHRGLLPALFLDLARQVAAAHRGVRIDAVALQEIVDELLAQHRIGLNGRERRIEQVEGRNRVASAAVGLPGGQALRVADPPHASGRPVVEPVDMRSPEEALVFGQEEMGARTRGPVEPPSPSVVGLRLQRDDVVRLGVRAQRDAELGRDGIAQLTEQDLVGRVPPLAEVILPVEVVDEPAEFRPARRRIEVHVAEQGR